MEQEEKLAARPEASLSRADLANAVHRNVGLSVAHSARIVGRILEHMTDVLAGGEHVEITGFGAFEVRQKGERVGRNIKHAVAVRIPPSRVVTFRLSRIVRDQINAAD